jgi:hypothetical protein
LIDAIEELRVLASDFKEFGSDSLTDKILCALAAITGAEEPRPDISYTYVMRDLRKKDKESAKKFQIIFKDIFEEALDNGIENPEKVALMEALQQIDFEG